MNSLLGRVTLALAIPASPKPFMRKKALSAGWAPRSVPPISFKLSFGLKGRAAQSAAWKGEVETKGLSSASETKSKPEPKTVAAVALRSQLVGLKVKLGLSV